MVKYVNASSKLNMEKIIDRYNTIMNVAGCYNFLNDDGTDGDGLLWTLRDMVAEAKNQLDFQYDIMSDGDPDCKYDARLAAGRLERFIKAYEPYIADMKTVKKHHNRYDT